MTMQTFTQLDSFTILGLSVLPALLYVALIYLSSPVRSINIKTALRFFFVGFISILLSIYLKKLFFPNGYQTVIMGGEEMFFFKKAFFNIAILEEGSKLLAFLIGYSFLKKKNEEFHPIGLMFYCSMVSLGFAVLENFEYGLHYGQSILLTRTFTAVIVHLTLGLMMGYAIAHSKIKTTKFVRTPIDMILRRSDQKMVYYAIFGWAIATFFHGLYDLNLFLKHGSDFVIMIIIIGICVATSYWMYTDLVRKYLRRNLKN